MKKELLIGLLIILASCAIISGGESIKTKTLCKDLTNAAYSIDMAESELMNLECPLVCEERSMAYSGSFSCGSDGHIYCKCDETAQSKAIGARAKKMSSLSEGADSAKVCLEACQEGGRTDIEEGYYHTTKQACLCKKGGSVNFQISDDELEKTGYLSIIKQNLRRE